MHFNITTPDPSDIEVELHVGMQGKQGHGHGAIGHALGNHQGRQSLSEGIVMCAGMPNGDFVRLPGLHRPHGHSLSGHHGDVATPGSACVLGNGQRMQFDDARPKLEVGGRLRGAVPVASFATERVIERPVFDISLPALHDRTTFTLPTLNKGLGICLGKVQVRIRHHLGFLDAPEAQLTIGPFET